jgi:hypothetical protein
MRLYELGLSTGATWLFNDVTMERRQEEEEAQRKAETERKKAEESMTRP